MARPMPNPFQPDQLQTPSVFQPMDDSPVPAPFQQQPNVPTPNVFAPAPPTPSVFSPLQQNEDFKQARLEKLQHQDVDPWGSPDNHPGVFGKIAHGLSLAGNIAGNIFAPAVMANIPGTDAHRMVEEQGLNRDIQGLEHEKVANAAQQAEADRAQQETQNAQAEEPGKLQNQKDTSAHLQAETTKLGEPAEVAPDRAVYDYLTKGLKMSPQEAFQELNKEKAEGKPAKELSATADLQNQIEAANAKGDKATVKKLQQQLKDLNPMGEQRIVIQQGAANNAAATRRDAQTEKEYTTTAANWNKRADAVDKQSQAAQAALQDIQSGNIGQAMGRIKLLSATASGQGSGVRITQTELGSLGAANGIKGDISAFINRAAGNGPMSNQEKQQALAFARADIQHAQGKINKFNQGLDELQGAQSKDDIRKVDSRMRHELLGEGSPENNQAFEQTATGKDGHKVGYRSGKWYDVESGKAVQ